MDFDFSQEQYMFQETTRDFLDQNYSIAKHRLLLEGNGIDVDLWEQLAATGVFSMLVPEQHGGMGLTFVDLALVLEEYGRALVPSPVAETIIATDVINAYGTDKQKARLLPGIAEGRTKVVSAITETKSGFDPAGIQLAAVQSGDSWRVSGRKILVPHAEAADLILVALRFGKDGPLGLAMLDNSRAKVSLRCMSTLDPTNRFFELNLEDTAISDDDILGGEPKPDSVSRLFDASGAVAAILMTGTAGKVLDDAVAYAQQRTQFGKPIGSFQAIKHKCADMAVVIDASRSAAYYAAWAMAKDSDDRAKAVSMAKSYCGDASRHVCNEGIQIHGGIGFTWELGLHFYVRYAKVLEYSYGDAAFHRERVLTAHLAELGRGN